MQRLRFIRLWLAGWIAALVAALVVCLLPMPALLPGVDNADKGEHALGFALLTLYAVLLFERRRALATAALGLLGFGLLIELLQLGVPWRSADPYDLLADATGIGAALLLAPTPVARMLVGVERWLFGGRA